MRSALLAEPVRDAAFEALPGPGVVRVAIGHPPDGVQVVRHHAERGGVDAARGQGVGVGALDDADLVNERRLPPVRHLCRAIASLLEHGADREGERAPFPVPSSVVRHGQGVTAPTNEARTHRSRAVCEASRRRPPAKGAFRSPTKDDRFAVSGGLLRKPPYGAERPAIFLVASRSIMIYDDLSSIRRLK